MFITNPVGVQHGFNGTTRDDDNNPSVCNLPASTPSFTALAHDGSGYTLNIASYTSSTLISALGKTINPPGSGTGTITDSNGNQVSLDSTGHFKDTTGNTALSVSGTAPNPTTLTYTDANGHPQTVTINYISKTVQTAFGCSGINEYGPTATSLVDSIMLPDNSAYHFTYEPTPNGSGNVTGRIASVTLPQGGVITWSYTGGSNEIICADGSTAGLTRNLSADSGSAASTWTYTRSSIATTTSHTDVTDVSGNKTSYDFVIPAAQSNFYETYRVVNQGTSTQLLARQTCYNGQTSSCTTTSFGLPITQITVYESLNGQQRCSTAKYNTNGLQTDQYDYDFGCTPTSNTLLRHEVWGYGGSIVGLVTLDQVYEGSGTLAGQTNYSYDETTGVGHAALVTTSGIPQHTAISGPCGNLTTVRQYVSSSLTDNIYALYSYDDTGAPLTSMTSMPHGTTNYSYDATHTFVSTITPPTPSSGVSQPTSFTFDINTGLLTSTTDPNGTQTQYKNYDAFGRAGEIDNLDSGSSTVGKTTFSYIPTQMNAYQYQSASVSTDTETQYDGYGRPSRTVIYNGQGSNAWYQRDTCYDANGNANFQSYLYQGTGWATPKVCSGAGDLSTYDALGRVKSITHADGSNIQYAYTGRAMKITDENGKSRITQVDGLGRPTVVCEISSSSMQGDSPVSCGTDIAGNGFTTGYSYDLANHKTTVSQPATGTPIQQRIFQTDWLGRTTQTQEPERGQTNYSYAYNSTGLQVTRERRIRVQNGSTALDYTFDALNRRVTTWLESTDSGISGKMYWGSSNTPVAYRDGPTHFELQDWLGTERMRTSYTGTVEGSYSSLPFGDGLSVAGTDGDPYHFAVLDHDSATDTQHTQFRQYSSTQGHWMSPDPYDGSYDLSNPESFNRYTYVGNSPLSFVDPLGLVTLPPLPPGDGGGDGGGGDCWWCWDWGGFGGMGGPIVPPGVDGGDGGGAPNNSLMFAQAKGERNWTSKPDKPLKGVRPVVKGGKVVGWTVPSPDGKRIPKSLDWGNANGLNPNDPKWVAMGIALGAAGAAAETATGLEWWEILLGAAAAF